tara:strand:- start:3440 stop:4132 length:693 start_codon:yes stop_codon:yes gene_type:complete
MKTKKIKSKRNTRYTRKKKGVNKKYKKSKRNYTHKRKTKYNPIKRRKCRKKRIYTKKNYSSGDGMLVDVWGPSLWHFLHIMSFNYKVNPTEEDKKNHKDFIYSLTNILPCKYCRENLKKNLKQLPLTQSDLKNRDSFSRWVYNLHELINKMLNKKSILTYCDVRERYEHFRSRCVIEDEKIKRLAKMIKKEKGCVEPMYGKKSKCIITIVPKDKRKKSFKMDKKCIKTRK